MQRSSIKRICSSSWPASAKVSAGEVGCDVVVVVVVVVVVDMVGRVCDDVGTRWMKLAGRVVASSSVGFDSSNFISLPSLPRVT